MPAVIAAALLGAAAITFAVDVVSVAVSNHAIIWPYRTFARQMRQTTWSNAYILLIAITVTAVGILTILTAVTPARPNHLRINTGQPDLAAGITRTNLTRALRQAATAVPGVDRAEVKLRRRSALLTVSSPFRDPDGISETVNAAAGDVLDQLQLARRPNLTIQLTHPEGR